MSRTVITRETRDWWNTIALGAAALVVFLMIWLDACSSASRQAGNHNEAGAQTSTPATTSASSAPATQEHVPVSLSDTGEYAENIYDYAKANDWKNANVKLAALRQSVKALRVDVKDKRAPADRLDRNVAAVERAVVAKDRRAAMREANQVTLDAAEISAAYMLTVPVDITRLDYYGRELEVWAEAQDANKLQATAREMRQTWDTLRPTIEKHSTPEAKTFDALVARVESAKTPAQYTYVATLVLNEVDNLEKLFH